VAAARSIVRHIPVATALALGAEAAVLLEELTFADAEPVGADATTEAGPVVVVDAVQPPANTRTATVTAAFIRLSMATHSRARQWVENASKPSPWHP
jgi:hypothetical protein